MNFGGAVRVNRCGLVFIIAVGFLILLYAFGGGGQGSVGPGDDSAYGAFAGIQLPFGRDHRKVNLKVLLIAAIDVSQRGGVEVVAVRKSAAQLEEKIKGKTKEGIKDSATEGDFRSHKIMYYGLRKAFPGVKVISEEHTEAPDLSDVPLPSLSDDEVSNSMVGDEIFLAEDVVFWVDPLDATKEYTENLLQYVTTMVGVSVKGKPIFGVIHRPFQEETYWAVVGHGNSPNLNKAVEQFEHSSSDFKELNKAKQENIKSQPTRLIVSRSHAGNVQNYSQTVLGSKDSFKVISAAGAGYKVLEVIEDKADAYIHVTAIKKWDLCAGYAIMSALGGSMTTLNGESIDFSGDTEPLNTKGILAFMKYSQSVEKLKSIKIPES